jgi:hypothetical protein
MSIGKSSQTHVRILTETAVSRRRFSRTIRTSSLCRPALATAVICSALVTGAALPASADGGTGGDTFGPRTPAVTVPSGAFGVAGGVGTDGGIVCTKSAGGGAGAAGGYNNCTSELDGDAGFAGASGNIVAHTNQFDVEPV